MSVRLRPLQLADLPAVAIMEQTLFGEDAWSIGMLQSELNGLPDRFFIAAEDAGEIVGYAGLMAPGGGQADVLTIAVAQHRWGEGIGAGLLQALLAEAELRGCTEVYLEVRVDNDRAQRLYRRHGFTAAGLRRGYYQPSGADALVMRRAVGVASPRAEAADAGEPVVGGDGPGEGWGPGATGQAGSADQAGGSRSGGGADRAGGAW